MCISGSFVQSLPYFWCDFPLMSILLVSPGVGLRTHSAIYWKMSFLSPLSAVSFPWSEGSVWLSWRTKMLCPATETQMAVSFALSHHSLLTHRLACQPKAEETVTAHQWVFLDASPQSDSAHFGRLCYVSSSWDQDNMLRKFILSLLFLVVVFQNERWTLHTGGWDECKWDV